MDKGYSRLVHDRGAGCSSALTWRQIPRHFLWVALALLIIGLTLYSLVTFKLVFNFTSGLFLVFLGGSAYLLIEAWCLVRKPSKNTVINIRLSLVSVLVCLCVAELVLRQVGAYHSYTERNGISTYGFRPSGRDTWYHLYPPRWQWQQQRTEFLRVIQSNSLGLPDAEWPTSKPKNEYRIIALGDSFTAGVGADPGKGWVPTARQLLAEQLPHANIRVLNAGVGGSDLFYEYVLLRDRLLEYEPDLIIVALGGSDVHDIAFRGGMERFRADGSTRFAAAGPWWQPLYGFSYIGRHIAHDLFGFDRHLEEPAATQRLVLRARDEILVAVNLMAELGRTHGFRLVLALHPAETEIRLGRYVDGLGEIVGLAPRLKDLMFIDLLQHYRRTGAITPANVAEHYWKLDRHHTNAGYWVMGEAITQRVHKLLRCEEKFRVLVRAKMPNDIGQGGAVVRAEECAPANRAPG